MSLLGEVCQTAKEDVYIRLDIDKGTGGTYPYPWRPETGNMMYLMPQVGTKVSLYFPNFNERKAMAINCFRTNDIKCTAMADSSKRGLVTEHGKEMQLYPSKIDFTCITGSMKLDDDIGISFKTNHPIQIVGESINLKAPMIHVKAPQEINIGKVDLTTEIVTSSIAMSNQFDIISRTNTIVSGRVHEAYPPFDDAPVEKGFDWGQLAMNVLGAILIVVCVVLAVGAMGALAVGVISMLSGVATSVVATISGSTIVATALGAFVSGATKLVVTATITKGITAAYTAGAYTATNFAIKFLNDPDSKDIDFNSLAVGGLSVGFNVGVGNYLNSKKKMHVVIAGITAFSTSTYFCCG